MNITSFISEKDLLDLYDSIEQAEEQYAGTYDSLASFAQMLTEETETDGENCGLSYISYKNMGEDMRLSGQISVIEGENGKLHIFWA